MLISLGAFLAFYAFQAYRPKKGPISPDGYRVEVHVSDTGWGWGADYYADVVVVDGNGIQLARWNDPSGQQSSEGVEKLVASMRWIARDQLEFKYSYGETERLSIASRAP